MSGVGGVTFLPSIHPTPVPFAAIPEDHRFWKEYWGEGCGPCVMCLDWSSWSQKQLGDDTDMKAELTPWSTNLFFFSSLSKNSLGDEGVALLAQLLPGLGPLQSLK